jgi:predicted alpha/beta superfamily hydrolase
MKRRTALTAIILSLLAISWALASCSGGDKEPLPPPPPAQRPEPKLRDVLIDESKRVSGAISHFSDFTIPQLDRTRDVWVYTPPSYEDGTDRFPVLYMHDGQNLFYPELSFAGEWEIDETLDGLHSLGLHDGLIVVAIANGETNRAREYVAYDYQGGISQADEYLSFIVETLKPFIDEQFRTLPDPENTALSGSSFGGHISLYGGIRYPEIFGLILAFSPSLWPADGALVREILNSSADLSRQRIYLDFGSEEGQTQEANVWLMHQVSQLSGIYLGKGAEDSVYFFGQGDGHNERAWRTRFPIALSWAFGFELPVEPY